MRSRFLPSVCLLLALCAPAHARSLTIEKFDAVVFVHRDGTIEVTETIQPRFTGAWNGIYRLIPVEYRTPQALNYTLLLDVESVTESSGQPLRYEVSGERHYKKIKVWVPGAVDTSRTIVLRYIVRNGLKFFEDHDELYWNVTGDEWEVPIESASARVSLPENATGVRATAFTGNYGSREKDASVSIAGSEVAFQMLRPLAFREGLTVVVGWDRGVVEKPGVMESAVLFLRGNWPLGIPLAVLFLMLWLWQKRGRDPKLKPIVAQYEPPSGMTPAEVGTLTDNSPDMRDITATLVDLAVRGFLLIEEIKEERWLGLWNAKDYRISARRPPDQWGDLKPFEHSLLLGIFFNGSSPPSGSALPCVELSSLKEKFYHRLPGIKDGIYGELLARRYYDKRPDKVRTLYQGIGIVLILAGVLAGIFLSEKLGLSALTTVGSGVVAGAIVIVLGWFMPARTIAGARALEQVLGFEEFLRRVESERFDRMVQSPELFEKYLPYAMALGVDQNWVRAFEGICQEPPQWYRGDFRSGFTPYYLSRSLNQMAATTASAMTSAPRSSGGSGFSGGGSSGGGFGGGGGGGF